MGQATSKEQASPPAPSSTPTPSIEPSTPQPKASGGCPVKHGKIPAPAGSSCPMKKSSSTPPSPLSAPQTSSTEESACPVKHQSTSQNTQYNVYSQPLDPTNNMPTVANQLPSAQQKHELSTERQKSNIPKGGTEEGTWVYPSPQMFYNALARKNKLDDTTESDVTSVVALHNNMNEKTWAKVLEWEELLHPNSSSSSSKVKPKLSRFLGRPSDLSPKAWVKNMLLNHPLPFDRHDWTVLRDDGTEVRYVIDYYHDETRASELENSGLPNMDDHEAVQSILVDVRPAVDSVWEMKGRWFTMPIARQMGWTKYETLPMFPTTEMKGQVKESVVVWDSIQKNAKETKERIQMEKENKVVVEEDLDTNISQQDAKNLAKSFAMILQKCGEEKKRMESCDPEESAQASLALSMCMSQLICPLQHKTVVQTLHSSSEDEDNPENEKIYEARVDAALENMLHCVGRENERVAIAKQTHPSVFEE